ncbi:hypothetical protein ACFFRR_005010 [Megaselia abdita]
MLRYITITLMTLSCFGDALIVPNELPSILSLIFSTIPQVKKGTDSRVGFGFRLGDHADFQVMLELGPQTNTKPVGTSTGDSDNTFKRQVSPEDYNTIQKDSVGKESQSKQNDASKWLKSWYRDTNKRKIEAVQETSTKIPKEMSSVKTMAMISQSSLTQLQQLYKWAEKDAETETTSTTTTLAPLTTNMSLLDIITPRNKNGDKNTKELMDVELD